ncbi:hypothetical protein ACIREO_14180 [Streptomyces sp. NPDC102441]|uniref:hypothetical protein n=1 Tax=Streptomyces sp. NPDC102441 TaxID=3366176 RepID=UPI00380C94C5
MRPDDRQFASLINMSMDAVAVTSRDEVESFPIWIAANDWLKANGHSTVPLGAWSRVMASTGCRMTPARWENGNRARILGFKLR